MRPRCTGCARRSSTADRTMKGFTPVVQRAWECGGSASLTWPAENSPFTMKTARSGSYSTGRSTTSRNYAVNWKSRGHQFYTHSDTEVIVHLYEEMGADCVKKLRGMFAIALYDTKQDALLLARDRLGKKPLHYAMHQGRLLFGSEIKTILALHPELAEVDSEGLLQYFYFGYIPDPHTAFQRIRKLPAGHLMEFRNGEMKIRQYWDLPEYGTHPPISENDCLEELERRLEEAVRIRLISDVPLGALLSGGVDSSIIVALMARTSAKPVKTFSIGFRAEQFDESEYARLVAERFGTEHHELCSSPIWKKR